MTINWRLEAGFCKSIFDNLRDMGTPIPEAEKVNIICLHCQYHTSWKRAEDWINCGWCLEFVGNGADMRKAESARYKMIADIKKAIADAELQAMNLDNKILITVEKCSDRDRCVYQNWQFLPSADHARMLEGIKQLIAPKLAAIAQINSVTEEYYASIDF